MATRTDSVQISYEGDSAGAVRAAQEVNRSLDSVEAKAGGIGNAFKGLGGVISGALSVAGGLLITKGLDVAGQFLSDAISEAKQNAESQANLMQALQATSAQTGVTAGLANELASSLQLVTKFTDDEVMAVEATLGRFSEIGKDVFAQTTSLALDLATALGTDSVNAAKLLGKALAEPGTGLARLRAAGVVFSDAQEKVIASLFKTGHAAEAQKLILDELQKTVGGTAEAMGKTFEGQAAIFSHMVDDIKQSVGDVLLPILNGAMGVIINIFRNPAVQAGIKDFVAGIGRAIAAVFTFMEKVLNNPLIQAAIKLFVKGIQSIVGVFQNLFAALDAGRVVDAVKDFVSSLLKLVGVGPDVANAMGNVFGEVTGVVQLFGGEVVKLIQDTVAKFPAAFDAFNKGDLSAFLEVFDVSPEIAQSLEDAWTAVDQGFKNFLVASGIQGVIDTVRKQFDGLRTEIQNGAKGLWDAWNTFQNNGPLAFSWFARLDKEGISSFLQSFNVSPQIADFLEKAFETAKTGVAKLPLAFDNFNKTGIAGFLETFNVAPDIVTFFANAETAVRDGIAKIPIAIDNFKKDGMSGFLGTFNIAPAIGTFLDTAALTVRTKLEEVRLAVVDKVGKLPAAFEGFKKDGLNGFLAAFDVSPEIRAKLDTLLLDIRTKFDEMKLAVGAKFDEIKLAVDAGIAKVNLAFAAIKAGDLDAFLKAFDIAPGIRTFIENAVTAVKDKFAILKQEIDAGIANVKLALGGFVATGNLDGFLKTLGVAPEVRLKIGEIITAVKEKFVELKAAVDDGIAKIPVAFDAFKRGDLSDFLEVFNISPEVATKMEAITTAVKTEIDKLPAKFNAFKKGDLSDFLETFNISPEIAKAFEDAVTEVDKGIKALNLKWGTPLTTPPPKIDTKPLSDELVKMGGILTEKLPGIQATMKTFGEIFGALNLILTPLGTAIASVATGLGLVSTNSEGLKLVLPTLSEVFRVFVETWGTQAAILINTWDTLKTSWGLLNTVAEFFKTTWASTVATFEKAPGLIDAAKKSLEGIGSYIGDTLNGILTPFAGLVERIAAAFNSAWDFITKTIDALGKLADAVKTSPIGGLINTAGGIIDTVGGLLPKPTPPPFTKPLPPPGSGGSFEMTRSGGRNFNNYGSITVTANNVTEMIDSIERELGARVNTRVRNLE